MAIIVTMNGAPESGKTSFEMFCQDYLGSRCCILSTVALVKRLCTQLGWDGNKTPECRKFLSDMKDLLTNCPWGNLPMEDIKTEIKHYLFKFEQFDLSTDNVVFFVDVREPEQLKQFKEELGAVSVLIRNEKAEAVKTTNHADSGIFGYEYDYCIYNDGSLEELKDKAIRFCQGLVR